jgi:hypothetical protein
MSELEFADALTNGEYRLTHDISEKDKVLSLLGPAVERR